MVIAFRYTYYYLDSTIPLARHRLNSDIIGVNHTNDGAKITAHASLAKAPNNLMTTCKVVVQPGSDLG